VAAICNPGVGPGRVSVNARLLNIVALATGLMMVKVRVAVAFRATLLTGLPPELNALVKVG